MLIDCLSTVNSKSERKSKKSQRRAGKKSKKKGTKYCRTTQPLKFRQDFRAIEDISEKYPSIETNLHFQMQDELLLVSNVL